MRRIALLLFITLGFYSSFAQGEKRWIKERITQLSSGRMHGRGYVNKGGEKAAAYIQSSFREFGILPFEKDSTYLQDYFMSINTFPEDVMLELNGTYLRPGHDYLVDAGSSPYFTEKIKLKKIDLKKVKDSASWAKVKAKFESNKAYWLKNSDTVTKYVYPNTFVKQFPKGLFFIPKHGKLTWSASQATIPATIFYVEDTVLPKRISHAAVNVESKFLPAFKNHNVIGFVPGTEKPDSFIVFTAHYDHLGRMGRQTVFPGAHDNASGTSLVLYLASYFAQHPQKYSVAFMLFSGEEAGLVGSRHYVRSPLFPLEQIRFVVNLDMTGDATNGITVVNGDEMKREFNLFERINLKNAYVPKVVVRGQTQNSDHYSFSAVGVPAIFIYTNGNEKKPYYHDVFDTAKELSLAYIDGLAKLLIEFTGSL